MNSLPSSDSFLGPNEDDFKRWLIKAKDNSLLASTDLLSCLVNWPVAFEGKVDWLLRWVETRNEELTDFEEQTFSSFLCNLDFCHQLEWERVFNFWEKRKGDGFKQIMKHLDSCRELWKVPLLNPIAKDNNLNLDYRKIAFLSMVHALEPSALQEQCRNFLLDPDPEMQVIAAETLGFRNVGIQILTDISAYDDWDQDRRLRILKQVDNFSPNLLKPQLNLLLKNRSQRIRCFAARKILKDNGLVNQSDLLDFLDPAWPNDIRSNALHRLGPPSKSPSLFVTLLENPCEVVANAVWDQILSDPDEDILAVYRRTVISDKIPLDRRITALGKLPEENLEDLPFLVSLIDTTQPNLLLEKVISRIVRFPESYISSVLLDLAKESKFRKVLLQNISGLSWEMASEILEAIPGGILRLDKMEAYLSHPSRNGQKTVLDADVTTMHLVGDQNGVDELLQRVWVKDPEPSLLNFQMEKLKNGNNLGQKRTAAILEAAENTGMLDEIWPSLRDLPAVIRALNVCSQELQTKYRHKSAALSEVFTKDIGHDGLQEQPNNYSDVTIATNYDVQTIFPNKPPTPFQTPLEKALRDLERTVVKCSLDGVTRLPKDLCEAAHLLTVQDWTDHPDLSRLHKIIDAGINTWEWPNREVVSAWESLVKNQQSYRANSNQILALALGTGAQLPESATPEFMTGQPSMDGNSPTHPIPSMESEPNRGPFQSVGEIKPIAPPPIGNEIPGLVAHSHQDRVRSSKVKAWVLAHARGYCELCKLKSFLMEDGTPYLEVHHLHQLANGGPDTIENAVALCPTCHRKLHHAARQDQNSAIRQLYIQIQRLVKTP